MLMLVSGAEFARQGSYRMVISVELACDKEADYLSPRFFPQPQAQIQAFTDTVHFEVLFDVIIIKISAVFFMPTCFS